MCYGCTYLAGELAKYIEARKIGQVRGAEPVPPDRRGWSWRSRAFGQIMAETLSNFSKSPLENIRNPAQIEAIGTPVWRPH